jgi:hypothetical protein
MNLISILENDGFKTVRGYDKLLKAIKDTAGEDKTPRCSGYGVFPDGRKCNGCGDCKKVGGA